MKTLLIASAAALSLSTAAFADQFGGQTSPAEFAASNFAQSHSEGDGPRTVPTLHSEAEVISSKGTDLAAFAAAKLANGPEDDR